MQDLKSDFYKRYSHEGGICDELFTPAAVTLFGIDSDAASMPVLSISLSFGTHAAYRRRSDDRLVLSDTDSDIVSKINKADIDTASARKNDIFRTITALPAKVRGFEMLLHDDVPDKELSRRRLCAAAAAAKMFGAQLSPAVIVRAAGANAKNIVSLLEGSSRAAVINAATLDYIPLNPNFGRYRIVIAGTGKRAKLRPDRRLCERELERIDTAIRLIKNEKTQEIFSLISESSRDMLRTAQSHPAELLFEICSELCTGVKLFNDMSGTAAFVAEENINNYVKLVDEKYEKKAGLHPAFYISD